MINEKQHELSEITRQDVSDYIQTCEPVAWRWGNEAAWLLTNEKPVSDDPSIYVEPLYSLQSIGQRNY